MSQNVRTVEEINEKIKRGDAVVLTATKMKELVKAKGAKVAANEVDVVTTGTFGAMCSSGAIINIGHTDPPIKIDRAWMNNVEVCHPGAAVDLYVGATQMDPKRAFEYGGGHVIEDLIQGKEVELRATAHGTDCYPRTRLETRLTKDDLNQFYLIDFRNGYQRYNCATNGRDETIYTYMGKLLPNYGNATFSGAGSMNPLCNDPDYETIGVGTRIFLGGGQGFVIGEGTQHEPATGFGNLMVRGDCKKMSPEFIRGAAFTGYGTTIYVGIGIPIPILNEGLAEKTAVTDDQIFTNVVDYGVPRRDRPTLRKISYEELKSGNIELNDHTIKASPLSSLRAAEKIAMTLQKWIEGATFYLTSPAERLSKDTTVHPAKQTADVPFVESLTRPAVTCMEEETVDAVAKRIIDRSVNHIIVTDNEGILLGIVTSWDITRAVANGSKMLKDIITRRVVTVQPDEPAELAARKLSQHNISALPVVDSKGKVVGIITAEDISKLVGRRE
jgi:L-aspartate semialdehyde sulfurtransferase